MSHYSLCPVVSLLAFSAVRQFPAFGDHTSLINEDVHESLLMNALLMNEDVHE